MHILLFFYNLEIPRYCPVLFFMFYDLTNFTINKTALNNEFKIKKYLCLSLAVLCVKFDTLLYHILVKCVKNICIFFVTTSWVLWVI